MRNTFAKSEAMTEEDILSTLRDSHRLQCHFDPEANPDVDLTFLSSIADWRDACDLVKCKPLGRGMNSWFNINHSDNEWRAVLEPKEKTLKGVCGLIATTATRPKIEPLKIAGEENLAAGVFIALRTTLKDNQVDVRNLRPSAAFSPTENIDILEAVSMVAPEILPPIKYKEPHKIEAFFLNLNILLMIASLIGTIIALFFSWELCSIYSGALCAITFIITNLIIHLSKPLTYIENIRTVGDICRFIATKIQPKTV